MERLPIKDVVEGALDIAAIGLHFVAQRLKGGAWGETATKIQPAHIEVIETAPGWYDQNQD